MLMCLLGTVDFGVTMLFTFVALMSMEQPQKLKPWKKIAPPKKFVTSMCVLNFNILIFFFVKLVTSMLSEESDTVIKLCFGLATRK